MQLWKFGASWCGPCLQLAKAQTLEKFVEAHPEVTLRIIELHDKPTTRQQRADVKLADAHDVEAMPTVLFMTDGDEPKELARIGSLPSRAMLERAFAKATRKAAELAPPEAPEVPCRELK